MLRAFAGGPRLSVGAAIRVPCGAARIEGSISNSSDYSKHLGEDLCAAFRKSAGSAADEHARGRRASGEVFAKDRYGALLEIAASRAMPAPLIPAPTTMRSNG